MAPKDLKLGDPCPACGGRLIEAAVPTPDMRRRFEDREIRDPYPTGYDTASEAQRAELGALSRCGSCGYQARFPIQS